MEQRSPCGRCLESEYTEFIMLLSLFLYVWIVLKNVITSLRRKNVQQKQQDKAALQHGTLCSIKKDQGRSICSSVARSPRQSLMEKQGEESHMWMPLSSPAVGAEVMSVCRQKGKCL